MNCTNKQQETAECEKRGCKGCFYEEKLITRDDYVLTNINADCYYVIRLKDDKEYKIYKEGKRDYILKDNKKIYLDDEVRKAVLSSIREYERYGI